MIRSSVACVAAMLVAGCAADRVTLLDNEDGRDTGSVAILSTDGGETVIDQANSTAALRDGPVRVRPVKEIRPAYAAILESLPPAARIFAIPFETGQSMIREDQRAVLELIRAELASRPGAQIEVAAFTDSTGSEDTNDRISLERAQNVAAELRGYGFPVSPGDAIGRGEHEAKMKHGDDKALAEYRRVDVIVR